MQNSVDVNFLNNTTRIGEDECGLSQTNIQNAEVSNYMLKNFYLQDCGMKKPIELATSQPNIFYSGSHNMGMGGCNVDESSKLLVGTFQTNPKCRISLNERPYKSVPYLGKGPSNCILESQLQQGNFFTNRKSIINTSEESYMSFKNYPLIDNIENGAGNPTNTVDDLQSAKASYAVKGPRSNNPIEETADPDWIRGGLPSRELLRSKVNM
tara:strand:+ start:675 stop:1307 length:633 start_codon:yes stop_codon:yes gene_type:complete